MSDDAIKLELINAALTEAGEPRVDQLASGEAQTTAVEANYELIVREELTSGTEWTFALKTSAPTLIGESAADIYDYEWTLPSDMLPGGLRAVLHRKVVTDRYDVENSKLLIDANTEVLVRYIFRAGESLWHPSFAMGIKHRLEAVAYRGFVENEQMADGQEGVALGRMARARLQQNHPREARLPRSLRRRRYGRP